MVLEFNNNPLVAVTVVALVLVVIVTLVLLIATNVLLFDCRANTPLLSEEYLSPTEPDAIPLSAFMIDGIVLSY
jgi:hypothetical protein